ncbi:hypothetical protein ACQPW1_10410 [Nocardia sp. CA-128927]|uniref:hypothetical protein n=1 Tax=Nocardia sp. CA-128927 TaxID=3239975 RepID=UPI003D997282
MSDALSPRHDLERAIRRYVAAESGGGLATDYLVFAAYQDPAQPGTGYQLILTDDISYHCAVGLAAHMVATLESTYE